MSGTTTGQSLTMSPLNIRYKSSVGNEFFRTMVVRRYRFTLLRRTKKFVRFLFSFRCHRVVFLHFKIFYIKNRDFTEY